MKCKICGEAIADGDVVVGILEGNVETDESEKQFIDVIEESSIVHRSCWKDSGYSWKEVN